LPCRRSPRSLTKRWASRTRLDTSTNDIDLEQNSPTRTERQVDQIDDIAMAVQAEDVEVDELETTQVQPDHLDIDSVGVGVEVVKHHNLQQADISLPEQQVDEDLEDRTLEESDEKRLCFHLGPASVDNENLLVRHDEGSDPLSLGDSSACGDSKDATPLSSTQGSPKQSTGLSRRQKKNQKKNLKKTRKKQSQPLTPLSRTSSEELRTSSEELKNEVKIPIKKIVPCKQYVKLSQPDQEIYKMLISYILSWNQMRQLGFPQESSLYPGKAYIYRDPDLVGSEVTSVLLNATAEEFIPSSNLSHVKKPLTAVNSSPSLIHSGTKCESPGSSFTFTLDSPSFTPRMFTPPVTATSDPTPRMFTPPVTATSAPTPAITPESSSLSVYTRTLLQTANSSPNLFNQNRESSCSESMSVSSLKSSSSTTNFSINSVKSSDLLERKCVRCSRSFYIHQSGQYYSQESCTYHWGKLRTDLQQYGDINQTYQCCGAQAHNSSVNGCSTSRLHVWSGFSMSGGIHGPLDGFIKTRTMKAANKEVRYTVYGLDCEMCYTTIGLELTKVTVVGIDGKLVYESLVQPENEIIDYNTRFSGITAKDLGGQASKTLQQVQQDMDTFISADSILIGHGLENDLRHLKLIHDRVIDTSLVFPHFYGLPYRRSLRSLAKSYLKREIQGNMWGHDSYEDARASIELMLWKVRKDMDKSSHDIIMQTDHRHI